MTQSRGINRPRFGWTAALDEQLRAHYPHMLTADLAAQLGATEGQCYVRAGRLGLRKSPEWLAGPMAQRLDGYRGSASRFRPGNVPWIAGKKLPGYAPGRAGSTQFKPGELSGRNKVRLVEIGGYRVSSDGYLDRKLRDDGPPHKRWERVHRLVWVAAHGPIPDDHCVVFKPRQKTTRLEEITLERLECVSRSELAARNRAPPELMEIYKLRGQIKRQINLRQKEIE